MSSSVPDSVLVLGATGTQGGAVARALLNAGVGTHALVRNPDSARAQALARTGARLITGDLLERGSLTRAFAEVECVYAITTPFEQGPELEVRQGETIVAAATDAGLGWLLMASVASAGNAAVPHFQSKARIERRVAASPVAWTVVAPTYFYENVVGPDGRLGADRLAIPVPRDTPLAQVALADLGAVVAAILARRDEHLGARVEVAADAPTPGQMAAALNVPYEQVALRDVPAPDLAAMYAFLTDRGYAVDPAAVRGRYPEVAWHSFVDWAQKITTPDRG
jgi:uncharacterized protein YbjT (DUF2867 family)